MKKPDEKNQIKEKIKQQSVKNTFGGVILSENGEFSESEKDFKDGEKNFLENGDVFEKIDEGDCIESEAEVNGELIEVEACRVEEDKIEISGKDTNFSSIIEK